MVKYKNTFFRPLNWLLVSARAYFVLLNLHSCCFCTKKSSVVLSALLADVIPFMSLFPFRAKVVLEMAHTNYKPELQITVGHRTVGYKI